MMKVFTIHAPVHSMACLWKDVGGWRMWNRQVAFSALDGNCQNGQKGMLYLRPVRWWRWALLVDQVNSESQMIFRLYSFGQHFELIVSLRELGPNRSMLEIQLNPLNRLARYSMPSWRFVFEHFMVQAAKGLAYAAHEMQ